MWCLLETEAFHQSSGMYPWVWELRQRHEQSHGMSFLHATGMDGSTWVVTRQMGGTNEFLQVKPNLPWDQRQASTMTVSEKIKASLHWPESLRWEWWWKYAFFHCILNNFVSKIVQLLFWNCLMSAHTTHLLMSPGIWGSLQIWGSRVFVWVVISPCLIGRVLVPPRSGGPCEGTIRSWVCFLHR